MTPAEFKAVIDDIEKNLSLQGEDDAYWIDVSLKNGGAIHDCSWRKINLHNIAEVICLEKDDHPPRYVSVSDIVVVKLCS